MFRIRGTLLLLGHGLHARKDVFVRRTENGRERGTERIKKSCPLEMILLKRLKSYLLNRECLWMRERRFRSGNEKHKEGTGGGYEVLVGSGSLEGTKNTLVALEEFEHTETRTNFGN